MTRAVVSVRYSARLGNETACRKLAQPAITMQVLRWFCTALEGSEGAAEAQFAPALPPVSWFSRVAN